MNKIDPQAAPGRLELVRTFLNTWRIPNDTRQPSDELSSLPAMQHFYSIWFADFDANPILESASEPLIIPAQVRQLRTDLRSILGTNDIAILSAWLSRQPIAATLSHDLAGTPTLHYRPLETQGCQLCAEVLALVVEAIAHNTWTRLKSCPDCQWVFYDHTKNKNKVWCLMTASGPQGRSCGSISKVRNFRQRQKALYPAPFDT